MNIRSLVHKHDEFQAYLERRNEAHIVGLSETWLDSTVSDGEIGVLGFKIYRRDRIKRGGGVMVYVTEDIKCVRRRDLESEWIEALWLEVELRKKQLLVCNIQYPT